MHRLCPLCGADNHAGVVLHSLESREIKRCSCGMVYLENPQPAAEVGQPASHESRGPARPDKLQNLIRRHFKPGNVLELGCGSGDFLQTLDPQYVPFGIEMSRVLAPVADEVARGRGGWVVHAPAAEGFAMFSGEHFSGVIMDTSLEYESHPVELLQQCARHLTDDGRVIIRVLNYECIDRRLHGDKWRGFRESGHLNYFTPSTLVRICSEAELGIYRFGWNDRHPFADSMWLVAGRRL